MKSTPEALRAAIRASQQRETGRFVERARQNFKTRPLRMILAAFLLGRRVSVEHLGRRFRIAWWNDQPYLLSIREV